jgi:hypothetical protein
MRKYLIIAAMTVLTVLLTGCNLESQFKSLTDPIQNQFKKQADNVQKQINALAGENDSDNDPENNTDLLGAIGDSVTLVQDVASMQDTLFNNPNFLDLTPITDTVAVMDVGIIPIDYYPAVPEPIRVCTYSMDQLEPGAGQSMTALGMVQWLALAIAMPFTMMRALTATTDYLGPLGFLLTWVTIAGLWFLGILTLDFIVGMVRNSGGLIKLFIGVARLFK